MFIKGLGSSYINQLKWRGTWAFVVQRLDDRNIVYGESFQDSPEYNQWGKPVKLRTSVKLLAENFVNCNWGDSDVSRRRKEFCEKFEGYDNVCNCKCRQYQKAGNHVGDTEVDKDSSLFLKQKERGIFFSQGIFRLNL